MVMALAQERSEVWVSGRRYLDMTLLTATATDNR